MLHLIFIYINIHIFKQLYLFFDTFGVDNFTDRLEQVQCDSYERLCLKSFVLFIHQVLYFAIYKLWTLLKSSYIFLSENCQHVVMLFPIKTFLNNSQLFDVCCCYFCFVSKLSEDADLSAELFANSLEKQTLQITNIKV